VLCNVLPIKACCLFWLHDHYVSDDGHTNTYAFKNPSLVTSQLLDSSMVYYLTLPTM